MPSMSQKELLVHAERLRTALCMAMDGLVYCRHTHLMPKNVKPEKFNEWQVKDHYRKCANVLHEINQVFEHEQR